MDLRTILLIIGVLSLLTILLVYINTPKRTIEEQLNRDFDRLEQLDAKQLLKYLKKLNRRHQI